MKTLLLPFFLFLFVAVQAQESKTGLIELYGAADAVVLAEVVGVKGGNFTAKVKEAWKGDAGKQVEVSKYRNTKVARRWGKYAEGERLLLFLSRVDKGWEIMGTNGEGEKLMMMDKVYLDGRGGAVWNRFSYFPVIDDVTVYAEEVAPAELKAALAAVAECFSLGYTEMTDKEGNAFKQVYTDRGCGEGELDQLRALSEMANELTNQAERLMR